MGDDVSFSQYTSGFKYDADFRQAAIASLIITILPVADWLLCLIQEKDKMAASRPGQSSIGLSQLERVMFIIGIACHSTICFQPLLNESPRHLNFTYWGFENLSTILTVASILSFLCRCSALNHRIAMVIGLLVCCTGFFNSLMFTVDPGSFAMLVLGQTCRIAIAVAAGVFVLVCMVSIFKTVFGSSWSGKEHDSLGAQEQIADDRFRTGVISVHMLSLCANLCLCAVWYWFDIILLMLKTNASLLQSAFIYAHVACAVLVFTAETYVQKNETAKALMSLVESKKNYVRYISHEIRTPLSATVMGLRVLDDTLRQQNVCDDDTFDTLKDVQSSCTAALDILNDLLSFNKLESGE